MKILTTWQKTTEDMVDQQDGPDAGQPQQAWQALGPGGATAHRKAAPGGSAGAPGVLYAACF